MPLFEPNPASKLPWYAPRLAEPDATQPQLSYRRHTGSPAPEAFEKTTKSWHHKALSFLKQIFKVATHCNVESRLLVVQVYN